LRIIGRHYNLWLLFQKSKRCGEATMKTGFVVSLAAALRQVRESSAVLPKAYSTGLRLRGQDVQQ
jgi:hypothetical protein